MTFRYENQKYKQGYSHVIGCDEVGKGSLAGPVVAVAIILDLRCKIKDLSEVRDSKMLSQEQREKLQPLIKQHCLAWGIGVVDEKTIDKINIHRATLAAMKLAVGNLLASFSGVILRPKCYSEAEESQTGKRSFARTDNSRERAQDDAAKGVLVAIDGKFIIPDLNLEQEAVVGGDNKILSVAAASIVAKVYRDDLMRKLHRQYPVYNFARHKGYGTLFHRTMIKQNGLSPIHRRSFCKNLSI